MTFLADSYEEPSSSASSYMKIQKGENKIRILSEPIFGYEEWSGDKKVTRYREKPEKVIDPKRPPKYFWSFIVWNYNEEEIQICTITQASIRKQILHYCKDKDWGQSHMYDIKITREGEDMQTKYIVLPIPHKPVAPYILNQFKERPCKLEALYDNDDPFALWSKITPCLFDTPEKAASANLFDFKDNKTDEASKQVSEEAKQKEISDFVDSWMGSKGELSAYLDAVCKVYSSKSTYDVVLMLKANPEETNEKFDKWKKRQNEKMAKSLVA